MKMRVRLTFPQDLIQEPVLFNVAMKYNICPNIRRAKITETVGEMVLEFDGAGDSIQKGIKALTKKGVQVDPVEGDVIE